MQALPGASPTVIHSLPLCPPSAAALQGDGPARETSWTPAPHHSRLAHCIPASLQQILITVHLGGRGRVLESGGGWGRGPDFCRSFSFSYDGPETVTQSPHPLHTNH